MASRSPGSSRLYFLPLFPRSPLLTGVRREIEPGLVVVQWLVDLTVLLDITSRLVTEIHRHCRSLRPAVREPMPNEPGRFVPPRFGARPAVMSVEPRCTSCGESAADLAAKGKFFPRGQRLLSNPVVASDTWGPTSAAASRSLLERSLHGSPRRLRGPAPVFGRSRRNAFVYGSPGRRASGRPGWLAGWLDAVLRIEARSRKEPDRQR